MKKLHILTSMLMGLVFFTACEDQNIDPVLQEPSTFTLNTPAFVNSVYDLENSTTLELTCTQPDYGFTAATSYSVEISLWGAILGISKRSRSISSRRLSMPVSVSTSTRPARDNGRSSQVDRIMPP